jgi:hypothetical protein
MIIVSPKSAGIDEFRELAKKRLGFIAEHQADLSVLKSLGQFYNLEMVGPDAERGSELESGERTVRLVPLNETDVATAFAKKAVDAVVIIIAPAAPKALDWCRLLSRRAVRAPSTSYPFRTMKPLSSASQNCRLSQSLRVFFRDSRRLLQKRSRPSGRLIA